MQHDTCLFGLIQSMHCWLCDRVKFLKKRKNCSEKKNCECDFHERFGSKIIKGVPMLSIPHQKLGIALPSLPPYTISATIYHQFHHIGRKLALQCHMSQWVDNLMGYHAKMEHTVCFLRQILKPENVFVPLCFPLFILSDLFSSYNCILWNIVKTLFLRELVGLC